MPDSHVPMPGETYLLPEEMPAAAATIQEGICFLNMCVVLCLIYQRSHYIVSVAPRRAPQEFSISLSLYVTLSNKCSCIKSRHEDKVPLFFKKVRDGPPEGLLGLPYVLLPFSRVGVGHRHVSASVPVFCRLAE